MTEPEITYTENFVQDQQRLFQFLSETIVWDDRMRARKTASFGVPYNYSGIHYAECEMPPELASLGSRIASLAGYRPNNCLCNFYPDGDSTMGFHSDLTDSLSPDSGIAIVSLGSERMLSFRRTADREDRRCYPLQPGSLLIMSIATQAHWQHGIAKDKSEAGRISLTFREFV